VALAHQVEDRQVEDRQVEDRQVEDRQVEDRQVEDRQVEDRQVEDRQVEDGGMEIMEDLWLQGSLNGRRNILANPVRTLSFGFISWTVTSMRTGLPMRMSKVISYSVSLPAKHAVSTTTPCGSTTVFP